MSVQSSAFKSILSEMFSFAIVGETSVKDINLIEFSTRYFSFEVLSERITSSLLMYSYGKHDLS